MLRPEDAYQLYSRAWNEPARTRALLEECWADDGVYADDEVPDGVVGRDALAELIMATHEELPGFRVWETSPTRMLAGRLCVTWTQEGGDPPEGFSGSDVIEFAADGRIARVTGVLAPTGGHDASDADDRAFHLRAGEGRRIWAFGDLMILKLTAEQSSGRVFVMEQHVPRHQGAPGRHVHAVDDQSWFVIAGRGRWFVGDETIEAGPGDFVHGPHGVPHAFSADTEDLHVLVITTPAGLEGLFAAMGVDASEPTHPPADLPEPPEDPELARRYGTTALGPEPRWTPMDIRAS